MTLFLDSPVILRLRLHTRLKSIPIPPILAQRINPNRILWHLPLLIIMILPRQALNRGPAAALDAALASASGVIEFVCEPVVVADALLGYVDFIADEYGRHLRFDHWPEDGSGGTDYREVDFYGGDDYHQGRPPGHVEVGVCGGLVDGDDVEAPDG